MSHNKIPQDIYDMVIKYTETIKHAESRPDLIADLWEISDDISNINPRGHQIGYSQLMDNFYKPLSETLSKRELDLVGEPICYLFDNTAIVTFYWQLDATLKNGSKDFTLKGRETQVLRKKDGKWKLIHLHYSGMPIDGFIQE